MVATETESEKFRRNLRSQKLIFANISRRERQQSESKIFIKA